VKLATLATGKQLLLKPKYLLIVNELKNFSTP